MCILTLYIYHCYTLRIVHSQRKRMSQRRKSLLVFVIGIAKTRSKFSGAQSPPMLVIVNDSLGLVYTEEKRYRVGVDIDEIFAFTFAFVLCGGACVYVCVCTKVGLGEISRPWRRQLFGCWAQLMAEHNRNHDDALTWYHTGWWDLTGHLFRAVINLIRSFKIVS